ncbi:MAG: hypothetical protein ACK6DN_15825 [Planctomycetota bacterium]
MSKSRKKVEQEVSREEIRRAKAFRKWQINWPKAIFGLMLLGTIAAAAIWQKSRDPSRRETDSSVQISKKAVGEIDSIAELELMAKEAERRLSDSTATYAGKVGVLEELATTCQRLAKLEKEPAQILNYKSKELLARYFKVMTCAEQGLDDTAERERVQSLVRELETAEDSEVRYQVNLAKLVLDGSTLVLRPDSAEDYQRFKDVQLQVVQANPDDMRLAALNKKFVESFKADKRFPSARFAELARGLVSAYESTQNLPIQTWVRELKDELLFEEFRYRDLLIKCELNSPGAYEAYLDTLPRILEGQPTPLGYARLLSAGNSFERVNRTREAGEVYRLIAASISQPAADELAEVARACESGQRRLSRIGKRFDFDAVDLRGRKLEDADFLGKPTVVVFMSMRSSEFESQLAKLQIDMRVFVRRGVNLLLVCLDGTTEEASREFSEGDLKIFRIVTDTDRSSALWRQNAAEALPLIVLVNAVGEVQRYANLDVHLMTTIDGELSRESR